MRIIKIITNELVVQKQKLEAELERVLNMQDVSIDKKLEKSLKLINKLSMVNQSFVTWESYQQDKIIQKNNMETLTELETLVTSIKVDAEKFFDKKNKSAGIRARKSSQELKAVLQTLRKEILEESKK